MATGTVRELYRDQKRELEGLGPHILGGEFHKMSEEYSKMSGDIIQESLHKTRVITSMLNDVVRRLLRREHER